MNTCFSTTWEQWTNDGDEAIKNIVPLSLVFTPLNQVVPEYDLSPLRCPSCEAILNECNYTSQGLVCLFCSSVTRIRPRFDSDANLNEICYIQARKVAPYRIVLVIDGTSSELEHFKQSLLQCLAIEQRNAEFSVVFFYKHIYVFDFSSESQRCIAINGEKDYSAADLHKILGITSANSAGVLKFFCSSDHFTLTNVLETLASRQNSVKGQRPERAAGVALKVATELLKLAASESPGKILLYLSGAPTVGPGRVAGLSLNEALRTFVDIKNNKANYLSKAKQFYDSVANDMQKCGHSIDIFSCSIDQSGLFELESLPQQTGGYLFMHDSCDSPEFKANFLKYFSEFLVTFSRCTVRVNCSETLEICGCVSLGYSIPSTSKNISSIQVGLSGSNMWGVNSLDKNTTFTFFFHPKKNKSNRPTLVQVETRGISPEGKTKTWVNLFVFNPRDGLRLGFNCETSAVITAKLAVWRLKTEDFLTVSNWIDKSLISFTKQFSKIEAKNVLIPSEISLFPQFLYFLRRSQFVNSFNVSPDESAYYRQFMLRYSVQDALLMIEPVLMSYSFYSDQPEPMFLSPDAMKDDRILLFDNFFQIIIWRGRNICAWVQQGYDKMPDYQHLNELLENPKKHAEELMNSRFPLPKIIQTKPRDGQERFIKARLDTQRAESQENEFFSDIMSIETFIERLKKFVLN